MCVDEAETDCLETASAIPGPGERTDKPKLVSLTNCRTTLEATRNQVARSVVAEQAEEH